MKKLFFLLSIIILLSGCGVSFKQVSEPILEKYGEPDKRTEETKPFSNLDEEVQKILNKDDNMSIIKWGYLDPKIIVIFERTGNKWKSTITRW
jgi:hypothetical protein